MTGPASASFSKGKFMTAEYADDADPEERKAAGVGGDMAGAMSLPGAQTL